MAESDTIRNPYGWRSSRLKNQPLRRLAPHHPQQVRAYGSKPGADKACEKVAACKRGPPYILPELEPHDTNQNHFWEATILVKEEDVTSTKNLEEPRNGQNYKI